MLTITSLPVVVAIAVFRSHLINGRYGAPNAVLNRDWAEDVTWTFGMALRELFGDPEIAESSEDEVASSAWLDAWRSFPSDDSPQVLRVVAELTEFQGRFDFSDPQRVPEGRRVLV